MNVALLALELVSPSRSLPVDSLRCCCPSWWCCPEGPELVPGRSQVFANHIHNFTRHRAKLLRPSSVDVLQEPTDRAPREGPRIQPGVRRLHTGDQRQFAITIATRLRGGLQRRRGWQGLHCRDITREFVLASSSLPSAKKLVKSYESHNGTTCCPSVRSAATHDARRRSP